MFHAIRNWRACPEIVAPQKRNYRIPQRIDRVHRRARGAHLLAALQECQRVADLFQTPLVPFAPSNTH